MAVVTNYLADKLLNHTFRNTAYAAPATVYLSLHKADPTRTGSHVQEVSGGGYARKAITFAVPGDNGTAEEIANSALVDFGTASAAWGDVTHWAVEDALSAGNMLVYGHVKDAGGADVTKTIQSGDPVSAAISALKVSLS